MDKERKCQTHISGRCCHLEIIKQSTFLARVHEIHRNKQCPCRPNCSRLGPSKPNNHLRDDFSGFVKNLFPQDEISSKSKRTTPHGVAHKRHWTVSGQQPSPMNLPNRTCAFSPLPVMASFGAFWNFGVATTNLHMQKRPSLLSICPW